MKYLTIAVAAATAVSSASATNCPINDKDLSTALETLQRIDAKAQLDSGGVIETTGKMIHLRETSQAEFKNVFSQAMSPVVVEDTIRDDDPMKGWTCKKIASTFSEVRMRREYMDDVEIDEYTQEPVNNQRLGDAYSGSKTDWTTQAVSNGDDGSHGNSKSILGPKYAPNYLPWKEMTMRDKKTGIIWLDEFRKHIVIPYFLRQTKWSAEHIYRSPEMWFAPVGGSGAKAHADSHCEATISIQLSGKKKWRISPMHSFDTWGGLVAKGHDGQIDLEKWIPSHEVELTAGKKISLFEKWIL